MFYHFRQNNSGGSFVIDPDDGISTDVIIEAEDAWTANIRAEEIGIYFNGVSRGEDCSCCGSRWYRVDDMDGDSVPSVYSGAVHQEGARIGSKWASPSPEVFIHYADGHMEAVFAGDVHEDGVWWDTYKAVVTPWPLVEGSVVEEVTGRTTRAIAA